MTFVLALNYGGRDEIVRGVRRIAQRAAAGELDPAAITEETVADSLDTAGMPDPDLMIRTSGELRISNYLLWQIAYAELEFVPEAWPEFTPEVLARCIRQFGKRDRRFGGVKYE
jgi:undecaprenyl diphosphate synthase